MSKLKGYSLDFQDPVVIISITVVIFALLGIIFYFIFGRKQDFHTYTDDTLYNVHWRWEWKKDKILNLTCYCPTCDEKLVYENDPIYRKTYFLCNKCECQKAVIGGGDNRHALGIIQREILRKVRTKEYAKAS